MNSYVPLKPISLIDPITNVDAVKNGGYAVLQGGNKVSYKTWTSTSISNSAIQFATPPPSAGVIVSRDVSVTVGIRITFTGIVTTTNVGFVPASTGLNAGLDAPRQWPILGSLSSLRSGINNDSVSIDIGDMVHALTRYNIDSKLRSKAYSTTPDYPDMSFNYNDLVGTTRNPLANYGAGIPDTPPQRGSFPFTIVSNPVVTPTLLGAAWTAVVDMVVTEPIMLSPYFWGCYCENTQGFYNVNSMDWDFQFINNAFRMWSHANLIATSGAIQINSIIQTAQAQFNGFTGPAFSYPQFAQPLMNFKYISPNILTTQKLGPNIPIPYPYFDVQRYPTDISPIAFGSGIQPINSNNIQLSQIPRRMYVYVRPRNSVLQSRCDITDCFLTINNIQVQLANQSTLLSSASQFQLFQTNCKNHGEQSWQEWSGLGLNNGAFPGTVGAAQFGGQGSILCLDFATDLQLDSDQAPGMAMQTQIQVTLGVSNLNSTGAWDALPLTMYLIFVNEGIFTITQLGAAQHQLSILSKTDVIAAQQQPGLSYRRVESLNGGDFLGSLRNLGSTLHDLIKEGKIGSTILKNVPLPGFNALGEVVSNYGYGNGGCDMGGVAIQSGGMRMSKKDMRRSLMDR